MSRSIWAQMRGGPGKIYILAGVLTWPLASLVIYWGDRFTSSISSLGQPETSISLWAAGGYSLLISALILVAGWLQSGSKT
ncbi:hypothetical protein ACELLULO517_10460 [Acidisoma cellulosilytica]|uniref:Uncharacterized protein n=1 Tax=Acidisoma cellulosilyticum TaxID=2802395 RepID=A0A963Z2G9_9PROT|nr:hypothetical protein [Acidisoma cellulosilyticum]MCB8880655.1 hypothetical protein [Acidisoma cellulosilyticum]